MAEDGDKELKRRTDRELRFLSAGDKLRYIALAVLGGPLLLLVNVFFVFRVIGVFHHSEGYGVVTLAAFAFVIGIAALGADYWLFRWLKDEYDVFRWTGSEGDK